jgi:hypothetical protein
LLDAFTVVGYLFSNGDKGAGKTTLIAVDAEMAYLGQLILAGSSYACLRDLADYGATLAFDDAENVMDPRSDPDKRTLLLAGNRRGAVIAVKEQVGDAWQTRYVNTYCPRLFSAIRLANDTLNSRSIIVPLVRSGDKRRATASVQDYTAWPCDRRRLLDDLWALGLTHLPALHEYDMRVAAEAKLIGRDLEPWRSLFAVALWLQEAHQVEGLAGHMATLAENYQTERSGIDLNDPVRVAIKALGRLSSGRGGRIFEFAVADLTDLMNKIAVEDGLAEEASDTEDEDEDVKKRTFTNKRKVGWILRRLRFQKGPHDRRRYWTTSRGELKTLARGYGVTLEPIPGDDFAEEAPTTPSNTAGDDVLMV